MTAARALLLAVALALSCTAARADGHDDRLGWQYWALNCQGCHQPDASGTPDATPDMAGKVSLFLTVPGGRDYLVRVPGVAGSALTDAQTALLVNWMLRRFDPANLPADFKPYTAGEVGRLRKHPLRADARDERARLIALMKTTRKPETN